MFQTVLFILFKNINHQSSGSQPWLHVQITKGLSKCICAQGSALINKHYLKKRWVLGIGYCHSPGPVQDLPCRAKPQSHLCSLTLPSSLTPPLGHHPWRATQPARPHSERLTYGNSAGTKREQNALHKITAGWAMLYQNPK